MCRPGRITLQGALLGRNIHGVPWTARDRSGAVAFRGDDRLIAPCAHESRNPQGWPIVLLGPLLFLATIALAAPVARAEDAWSYARAAGAWAFPDSAAGQGVDFQPPKSLTVTLDNDYAPYSSSAVGGKDGEDEGASVAAGPQGIMRDLWDLWAKKTGVEVHYLAVDRAHRMELLDSGRADVVGFLLATDARLDRYRLATAPAASIDIAIFFDRDISGIAGVDNLQGFTVGVVGHGTCAEWLTKHGITLLREYGTFSQLFAAAARGEVNVFCNGKASGIRRLYRMHLQAKFRVSPPLYTSAVVWAVRHDAPGLRDFIAHGFELISAEERQGIEQRWIGQSLDTHWHDSALRFLLWTLAVAAIGGILLFAWNAGLRRQVAVKTKGLAASERRYRELIEAVPVGIFETDAVGKNVFSNDLWGRMSGLDRAETRGDGWLAAVHPQDRAALVANWRAAVAARAHFQYEFRLCRFDGQVTWIAVDAVPRFDAAAALSGYIGSVSDLTELRRHEEERRRLERQSEDSKKLEALGQFAGGIAHDFNNFLGAILGYAQFIIEDSPDHPHARYAQRILTAGRRGRALVEQILTFTRRTRLTRTRFHLSELLAEIEDLMFASAAGSVEFRCDNADPDAVVEADRDQLGQVLLNLCVNAQESLGGRPGTVSVSIRRSDFPAAPLRALVGSGAWRSRMEGQSAGNPAALPGPAGADADGMAVAGVQVWTDADGTAWAVAGGLDTELPHVSMIVTDSGIGMNAELLRQAFAPFFTTKHERHGTGLGLAVVRGIVTAHGAALVVRSRPGEGTSIEVAFPRVDVPLVTAAGIIGTSLGGALGMARTKGRILLVDDDTDFCDMMHLLLERLGFEVVPYLSGQEALKDFRELPQTWDALITDQNMHGISGLELVRAIRGLRPDLPCLICSAYSESLTEASMQEAGVLALIRKPVDKDLLLAVLRRALAGARDQAPANPLFWRG
jgi:PAS domain S-box-containing protein